MKALELVAQVDEQHRLSAVLSEDTAPEPVQVIVLIPEADEAESDAVLMRDWFGASTPALQAVWDNAEGAVYDDL